jgi:hypothetical protein
VNRNMKVVTPTPKVRVGASLWRRGDQRLRWEAK